MRKLLLFTLSLLVSTVSFAQLRLGVKAGISSTNLDTEDLRILDENGLDRLGIALDNSNVGIYGGFVLQAQFGAIILQPEIYYNSNSSDFKVTEFDNLGNTIDGIRDEKYQYLDIPILVGAKLGPLRVMAGPQGNIFLNSTSGLFDFEGYKQDFETLTLGWQGGIGLDIRNLSLDVRYEGNFSEFGDHIVFDGNRYDFNDNPSSWLFSLTWFFSSN